jgi:hypothetical protein
MNNLYIIDKNSKRMRTLGLSLLLYILLFSAACADERGGGTGDGTGIDSLAEKSTLKLSMDGDTSQYRDTVLLLTELGRPPKENEEITKIVMAYPQLYFASTAGAKDSINKFIEQTLRLDGYGNLAYKNVADRMTDFIDEYREAAKENKEVYAEMGLDFVDAKWSCEVQIQVLLNTPNLLTLRYDEFNFTGGAHGNMATRFFNFDMRTGKLLQLKDIFIDKPGADNLLMPLAQKAFRTSMQKQGKSMDAIDENFNFDKLPDHFAITHTGILFSFDPYEVSAFSEGTLQFEIPYADLLQLINRDIIR